MVRRADETVFFHPINQPRRAVVPNAQLTLNPTCRGLLAFEYNLARLAILRIFFAVIAAHAAKVETAVFGLFCHSLNIFWLSLTAPMVGNATHFIIGDKGPMNTRQSATTCHIEHVALTQQLFCTLFAKNSPAVDF